MGKKDAKDAKEPKEPPTKPRRKPAAQSEKPAAASRQAGGDTLDVLFVTSEMRPFAHTGGLSDVSSALPRALARLGHRVTVVLPKYRGAKTTHAGFAAQVPFGLHEYPVRFVEEPVEDGVTAVLIDAPPLYDRDGLYGDSRGEYRDNAF